MRFLICAAALAGALVGPAAATAAPSPHLWATINHCDVPGSAVGIRASMPGNPPSRGAGGTSQRMYMRFSAQYRNAAGRYVETGSSTRWIKVGSARTRSVQSGYDFVFAPPSPRSVFNLRGTVGYRWTAKKGKRWRIVRTAKRVTRAGIKGVERGVPRGASAASCAIAR
jgi:hypothetical protein